MSGTTRADTVFRPRSAFDDFLFAPIGEDRNGMPISVVSAFGRLDVDPWETAADLARLPQETAISRLSSMIAALAEALPATPDVRAIAARLIALLPRQAIPPLRPGSILHRFRALPIGAPAAAYLILAALIIVLLWLIMGH